MLPQVYSDSEIAAKIVEDPAAAPIPELHKAMYSWICKFVRNSWEMSADDMQVLRGAGVSDHEIAVWAQIATLQTYLGMMSDGGGVSLDYGRKFGPVVGRDRSSYTQAPEGLLAGAPGAKNCTPQPSDNADAWIVAGEPGAEYEHAANWATLRYGFVPNMFKAVKSEPRFLRCNISGLELLEAPQSETLSRWQHALVRALVSGLNRCSYSAGTTRALLQQFDGGDAAYEKVTGPWDPEAWEETDRLVLAFAIKAARNAYKIVERDAQGFRDAGLGDEGYVDVLNTVAIQTALDRLVNSLGVTLDDRSILSAELSPA